MADQSIQADADARVGEYIAVLFEDVGAKLEAAAGEPYGFALFTFPLNRPGTFHHMYQGQPQQVAHFLLEQAALIDPTSGSQFVIKRGGARVSLYKVDAAGEILVSAEVDCDLRAFNQLSNFFNRCNRNG